MSGRERTLLDEMAELVKKTRGYIRQTMNRTGALEMISHEVRVQNGNHDDKENLQTNDDLTVVTKIGFVPKKPN